MGAQGLSIISLFITRKYFLFSAETWVSSEMGILDGDRFLLGKGAASQSCDNWQRQ